MEKSILFLIMLIFGITITAQDFTNIKNFSATVSEKTIVNKKERKKSYVLFVKFPDKIYKEMISPEINKGEIYIYNGNKKTVYIPLLDQKSEKEADSDENYIIKVIKNLREVDISKLKSGVVKNEDGIYKINTSTLLIEEAVYDDNIVKFLNYDKISGNNFPKKVEVYENGSLVSQIEFTNIKVNDGIEDKKFKLK